MPCMQARALIRTWLNKPPQNLIILDCWYCKFSSLLLQNASYTTLLSNTSFAPNIEINVNTTSDSDSSADTSSNVSINGTYPVFIYENGTLANVTFIPVYPGWGFGLGGFGGTLGNIGRSFYENFDDILEQFTSTVQSKDTVSWIQSVDYEWEM